MNIRLPALLLCSLQILCGSLGCALAAHAGERVALVIGNSNYPSAPLDNPRNDANAMAELLSKAGFQVEKVLDTDLAQMKAAVDRFGAAIRDPKVKFGLFYYAGHGMQQDWHNYILPVSANIRSASDVPKQTVDVSSLLRSMEQAQGRSFLVILDACRDDPFAGSFRPTAKGLSQFDAPSGSLLAYATQPGRVARDGVGKNGLYTGFLLREFAVQGARLEDAFKRVRLSVRLASKGAQVPFESTSLEEDVQIFPLRSRSLSDAEKDQLLEREMSSWSRIKTSADPDELAGFIREFPSGSASELAQSRMNRVLLAMAEQETRRTEPAAKAAPVLALREINLTHRLAEDEQKRLATVQAEQEQARLNSEKALAAEQELRRVAATQAQTASVADLAAARAEAQAASEIARQSQWLVQAALAEALRIQDLKAQNAATELAQLAAAAPVLPAAALAVPAPAPAMLPATPFFLGYAEHQRRYSVGDEVQLRVIDAFTKISAPLALKVTQVDLAAERVTYNDGEFVSDLMGNITTNQRGSFSTPRQFYPAELIVGKKWHTRFKQSRPGGLSYTYEYSLKVVAKESITVPAGTFEAYKIEARGYNVELGARLERNIWVTPGINADIAHEIKVVRRNGSWDQNDRQELVSYAQTKP